MNSNKNSDPQGQVQQGAKLETAAAAVGLLTSSLRNSSLLACAPNGHAKAQWLEDFLASYPAQLIADGVWTQCQQEALEAEIRQAKNNQSLWQTSALVEQIWQKS